jgi:hypothetical protein
VSILGALSLGFVLGLSIVGAVLLRNEEKVKEAWYRRRADLEPKVRAVGRGLIVVLGLLVIANLALAVVSGDASDIVLAALWLLILGVHLLRYRRSQGRSLT